MRERQLGAAGGAARHHKGKHGIQLLDLGALEDPAKRVFIEAAANARTWQLGSDQRLLDELQTAMQAVFLVDEPIDAGLYSASEIMTTSANAKSERWQRQR